MTKKEIIMPAVILTVICFTVTVLLSLTNLITADKIAKAKADSIAAAMEQLVPGAVFNEAGDNIYSAEKDGQKTAYLFITEEMGYKSKIEVLTAVNASDGTVIGVTVTDCSDESPGIGQKVASEKEFTAKFAGKSKSDSPDGVKADAITGATFSSNAVTKAVNDALERFDGIKGGN